MRPERRYSLDQNAQAAADVVAVRGNHDNFIQNVLSEEGILAVDHVDVGGFRLSTAMRIQASGR